VAATTPASGAPAPELERRPEGLCPLCRAPYDADQEYCLECGLRLPARTGVVWRLGWGWRRRLRWYPGDWIWPVLVFLLVAAAGAAAAILLSDRHEPAQTLVATSPPGETTGLAPTSSTPTVPTVPTVATTAPAPLGPSTGTGRTTTTAPSPPPPPPKQTKPLAWPAGRRGYTVVLVSLPLARGRAAAVAQADKAMAGGLQGVGILNSSFYSSLHPGYYVVFTGIRDSQDATGRDLTAAQTGGYPAAYVRQITP
jgi:hypothetical protein